MCKCVCYLRYSPRPDAATSESCERQLALIREYAARQSPPWEIPDAAVFRDEGLSGADHDRPGLWSAIEALQPGGVLIVYKLDRLARDAYLSHIIDRAIKKRGARLVSVTGEGTWDERPEGKLIRGILRQLDEYNREVLNARTSRVMRRHQAAGRKMGGKPPFGWQIDEASPVNRHGLPGRLKPHEGERAIMRFIAELVAAGATIREMREILDERGMRPRGGGMWHWMTLKRLVLAVDKLQGNTERPETQQAGGAAEERTPRQAEPNGQRPERPENGRDQYALRY